MNKKRKNILRIIIGLALIAFTLFLIFSHGSKVVQSKIFGTYLKSDAVIEEIHISTGSICTGNRVSMSGGCSVYDAVRIEASYTVNNKDYLKSYILEKFITDTTGRLKASDKTQAEKFLNEYDGAVGDTISIYYDEENPEESILHQEDEIITWLNYLILFPGMILALGFIIFGAEGLSKNPL